MKRDRIISTYNAIAEAYEKAFSAPSRHITEFLKYIKPKSKILDLGCGTGNNSVYLSKLGHDVTGIDLSDKMLDIAKGKKSNALFINKNMAKLDFTDNSFDGIIAAYSFCCLPKKEILGCLSSIYKILKKEGVIFIELHEGTSAEVVYPEPFNPKFMLDINVMSQKEITELLKSANFEISKIYLEDKKYDDGFGNLKELCIIAKTLKQLDCEM